LLAPYCRPDSTPLQLCVACYEKEHVTYCECCYKPKTIHEVHSEASFCRECLENDRMNKIIQAHNVLFAGGGYDDGDELGHTFFRQNAVQMFLESRTTSEIFFYGLTIMFDVDENNSKEVGALIEEFLGHVVWCGCGRQTTDLTPCDSCFSRQQQQIQEKCKACRISKGIGHHFFCNEAKAIADHECLFG